MESFELYPLQIARDPALAAHLKAVALHEELMVEYQLAAIKAAERQRKIAALLQTYAQNGSTNVLLTRWLEAQHQKASPLPRASTS